MRRPLTAAYGDSLQLAAARAVERFAEEQRILQGLTFSVCFDFDFHGILVPMTAETTAEQLVAQVAQTLRDRAELYDATPAAADAYVREQGGKMNESLYVAVPAAVQCAQRWGNQALDAGRFETLRHAIEFNGLHVPINPWREGETERVLGFIEAHLGAPVEFNEADYFVHT